MVGVLAWVAAASCGAPTPASSQHTPPTTSSTSTTVAPPPSTSTTTTTIDPGLLPQTSDEPSFGAPLNMSMNTLWGAIVADSPDQATSVFFPRTAYDKMKAGLLPNPDGDYTNRLLAFFRLDIGAYHQLLASTGDPSSTTLVSVSAQPSYAAYIAPGHCENLIGYWHEPGVRIVYQQGSVVRSFAVDSLISWRGVWYVVHLGPNPRPSDVGTVDQPETGPGTPGPPGGC
jgi:hypothetical protein